MTNLINMNMRDDDDEKKSPRAIVDAMCVQLSAPEAKHPDPAYFWDAILDVT